MTLIINRERLASHVGGPYWTVRQRGLQRAVERTRRKAETFIETAVACPCGLLSRPERGPS